MVPRAAERADALVAGARAACLGLHRFDAKRLFAALGRLGMTGTAYDDWGTTMEEVPASELFQNGAALAKACAGEDLRAIAISLGLLAQVAPEEAYALVQSALPLDTTHFAPNYLEAYIQRALHSVIDRVQEGAPADAVEKDFVAGKLRPEAIPSALAARIPVEALGAAASGPALGYLHHDEAKIFLQKHPVWSDLAGLTRLLDLVGDGTSHAASAFSSVLFDRLGQERHGPSIEVALRLRAAHAGKVAGVASLIGASAFQHLLLLRHAPTLEAELAQLTARAAKVKAFDGHHTIPELRGPIAAGFALGPETASARFASWFAPKAVASARGAKVAHDILRGGQGIVTDHDGTKLNAPLGAFLDADPGWLALLEPLRGHALLGKLVKSILGGPAKEPAAKKPAPKKKAASKKKAAPKKTTKRR